MIDYTVIVITREDVVQPMEDMLSISQIIKRYIHMRGYSIRQVADKLGINYKTFDGILNRDVVDAKLLFMLANLLDIDLCWMSQLYEKKKPVSFLEQYQMSRMNSEMREVEQKIVMDYLDRHIRENPHDINKIKSAITNDFKQMFYLLDVLIPESYIIRIIIERGKEKYYCMPVEIHGQSNLLARGRISTMQFYEGHEMLKQIILERKVRLKI